jgi:hypothetical protein
MTTELGQDTGSIEGLLAYRVNDPQQLSYLDRIAESEHIDYNVKALYGCGKTGKQ